MAKRAAAESTCRMAGAPGYSCVAAAISVYHVFRRWPAGLRSILWTAGGGKYGEGSEGGRPPAVWWMGVPSR